MRKPTRLAAVLMAAALALAGCTSIPMSGPVNSGNAVAPGPGPVYLRAQPPGQDASALEIASGFLDAQTAGLTTGFDVAMEYLTPAVAAKWDALAQVSIYRTDLAWQPEETTGSDITTVTATADLVGLIGPHGVYVEQPAGTTVEVSFTLARNGTGQWRISAAEDGVFISQASFERFFRPTTLYFPTPDRSLLVPDERWFPRRNWQTYAVRETLAGPAPWLVGSVSTVVPDGVALSPDAVPVDQSGPVLIPLNDAAMGISAVNRGMLVAQLQLAFSDTQPRTVQLYCGNAPLTASTVPDVRPAQVSGDPVALAGDQVMQLQLRSRSMEPLADVGPLTDLDPTALAFAVDGPFVYRQGTTAIRIAPPGGTPGSPQPTGAPTTDPTADPTTEPTADPTTDPTADPTTGDGVTGEPTAAGEPTASGTMGVDQPAPDQSASPAPSDRATPDNPASPRATPHQATPDQATPDQSPSGTPTPDVPTDEPTPGETPADRTDETPPLLAGTDLVAPSIDRFHLVWSAEAAGGELLAVNPDKANNWDGAPVYHVSADWLLGHTIVALRVAPDGARIAVVTTTGQGGATVSVAGIVRNAQGIPTRLSGTPAPVAVSVTSATQVVWVDQTLLGVLGSTEQGDPAVVHLAPVGGPTTATTAVTGEAAALAAGWKQTSILVGTADGALYSLISPTLWTKSFDGVSLPAYPG